MAAVPPASAGKWSWPFVFEPYDIQRDLMSAVFDTCEQGQVAVVESPTGTGKSLSLICSALHWLTLNRGRAVAGEPGAPPRAGSASSSSPTPVDAGEPEWIRAHKESKRREEQARAEERMRERRTRVAAKQAKAREGPFVSLAPPSGSQPRRRPLPGPGAGGTGGERRKRLRAGEPACSDDEFAPSDDDDVAAARAALYASSSDDEVPRSLAGAFGAAARGSDDEDALEGEDGPAVRKVLFCSRTHSQLSQFLGEVRRTPYGRSVAAVALGSRKQLCTNPHVAEMASVAAINDRCLELTDQKKADKRASGQGGSSGSTRNSSGGSGGGSAAGARAIPLRSACPFFEHGRVEGLKDQLLVEVLDIESAAALAAKERTCGYFSARAAVREAELVALPYSMLLHRRTRAQLGIDLRGAVVICDEAHNVIEAINEAYSMAVESHQLTQAHAELLEYRERYRARLKPANSLGLNALVTVVKGLCDLVRGGGGGGGGGSNSSSSSSNNSNSNTAYRGSQGESVRVVSTNQVTVEARVDHINLFQVLDYVESSRICQKLQGFSQRYLERSGAVALHVRPGKHASSPPAQPSAPRPRASPLLQVKGFLEGLLNCERDGKVVITRGPGAQGRLKFLMLNPGVHFREVVEQAHCVVLAGGTMQPTADVEQQLFGGLQPGRLRLFSCGHVVPRSNLLCACVARGPTGRLLELTFGSRGESETMEEVGRCLVNICSAVPHGVVVFMPSYNYAQQLLDQWSSSGTLARLEARKAVFREQREAQETDQLLAAYANAARSQQGALLLSVVGGKLSEGINFADELARCVVMVGLPFPNPQEPELRAKMDYLDSAAKHARSGGGAGGAGAAGAAAAAQRKPSQEFYENQCMKAVNQCIGRAIRHRGDFASIVLIDARYARPAIASKLPRWIADGMADPLAFPAFYKLLRAFYAQPR